MQYIQIDNFNGNINIICKDDGSGDILVFDSLQEANDSLEENCQDGQVIPLGIDIMDLFSDCKEYVSTAVDEGFVDNELTSNLNRVLDIK